MPHRGRLNVLAHVLEKPYELIFAEFEGAPLPEEVLGDGDVKYHLGFSRDHRTADGRTIHVSLSPNPSHLEVVNPVVEGIVRAKQAYRDDVVIDFVCYRRHGHNEGDDPTLTQPVLYEQIRNHPTVVAQYVKRLAADGVVDEAEAARLRGERRDRMDAAQKTAKRDMPRQPVTAFGGVWTGLGWAGDDWSADTRVDAARLREIGAGLARLPAGFTPVERARRLLDERRERVARGEAIDWGTAESLAYGRLLLEGVPVRLSGQDSVRGTV